jgi:modulator of FtsH protease HflK
MNGLDRGTPSDGTGTDGPDMARQDSSRRDSPWGANDAEAASEAVPPVTRVSPWHPPATPPRRVVSRLHLPALPLSLPRPAKLPRLVPWAIGTAVALGLAATSLHPVGAHEQALISTAGAWGPAQGPGLAVSWPWPIGSARIEDVTTIRHLAVPEVEAENLVMTRDRALVDLGADVRWRVTNLGTEARALADPPATLRLAAENALRATLAGMDFADAMGAGRQALGHKAARRLQATLDGYHAGIAIDGIDVRRIDPPARLADALRTVATARGDAANAAVQAQAWSHQVIANAQGEAAAFDKIHEQYLRAPDVTRRQMYYTTMERVLAQSDKTIVDAPGTTLALPAPTSQPAANPGTGGNGR